MFCQTGGLPGPGWHAICKYVGETWLFRLPGSHIPKPQAQTPSAK